MMMCSHRLPYEYRCPFCFAAAMEVERLRAELRGQSDLSLNGLMPPACALLAARKERSRANERRMMALHGDGRGSRYPERRSVGSYDRRSSCGRMLGSSSSSC